MGLEYGPVEIKKGAHRYKVGWYDDDKDNFNCIVYFDNTMRSFDIVKKSYLRNIPQAEFDKAMQKQLSYKPTRGI